MTGIPRRQVLLLAVLAVIAIAGLMVAFDDGNQAERGAAPSNPAGQAPSGNLPDVPVVDLRLERLHQQRAELPDVTRDPFRFRPIAPPPSPPRSAAGPTPAPRPPEFTPPPVPTGPPPPPPIPVKFIGLVVLRGERVAAFSDTRGNTFHGREGDIIEGRYRVLRISTDSVDLAYLDGRGRQTIRLTGQ
jgi:hypothetical protein